MASTKSTQISNAEAATFTPTDQLIAGGRLREAVGTVEAAAADDAGHEYRLMRVHSSWRVSQLEIANDAITNMTTADIGLYDVEDGDVVDVDFFGSAVDMSSANAFTDYTYEATATQIVDVEQALWEQLGLSEDPNKYYEVAVTATTNDATGAGTIAGRLRYVSPS